MNVRRQSIPQKLGPHRFKGFAKPRHRSPSYPCHRPNHGYRDCIEAINHFVRLSGLVFARRPTCTAAIDASAPLYPCPLRLSETTHHSILCNWNACSMMAITSSKLSRLSKITSTSPLPYRPTAVTSLHIPLGSITSPYFILTDRRRRAFWMTTSTKLVSAL